MYQQCTPPIFIVKLGSICIPFVQVLPCLVLCAACHASLALPLFLLAGLVLPLVHLLLAWLSKVE